MYNSLRFPKNLSGLKQPAAFKEYCLNPLGLKTKIPEHFEKKGEKVEFLNESVQVYRGEKPLNENTFALKVDPSMSKPYLRQYLEKIYGLEVDRINTINYMGKIKRNELNKNYRQKDWKKAYVILKTPVPEFFQKVITRY